MVEKNGEDSTGFPVGTAEERDNIPMDEEAEVRTWRDTLPEISAILEACLEEAHGVLSKFADGAGTRLASIDSTVKLADSMFSAVVTAEAGRRQAEMQRQLGQNISIPFVEIPGQGLQIQIPRPPGGRRV